MNFPEKCTKTEEIELVQIDYLFEFRVWKGIWESKSTILCGQHRGPFWSPVRRRTSSTEHTPGMYSSVHHPECPQHCQPDEWRTWLSRVARVAVSLQDVDGRSSPSSRSRRAAALCAADAGECSTSAASHSPSLCDRAPHDERLVRISTYQYSAVHCFLFDCRIWIIQCKIPKNYSSIDAIWACVLFSFSYSGRVA